MYIFCLENEIFFTRLTLLSRKNVGFAMQNTFFLEVSSRMFKNIYFPDKQYILLVQ